MDFDEILNHVLNVVSTVGITTDPESKVMPAFSVETLGTTSVFTLPEDFTGRLFYYCKQHSPMGIHEITVV